MNTATNKVLLDNPLTKCTVEYKYCRTDFDEDGVLPKEVVDALRQRMNPSIVPVVLSVSSFNRTKIVLEWLAPAYGSNTNYEEGYQAGYAEASRGGNIRRDIDINNRRCVLTLPLDPNFDYNENVCEFDGWGLDGEVTEYSCLVNGRRGTTTDVLFELPNEPIAIVLRYECLSNVYTLDTITVRVL